MNVEREIAGFALPFTAGILVSVSQIWPICCFQTVLYLSTTGALLIYLSHPHHKKTTVRTKGILIVITAFFCGITTGETHHLISSGLPSSSNGLAPMLTAIGNGMSAAINRIPFQSKDTNAIINALLTGYRSDLPAAISEAFRDSGASHILALSGMHLGIIYGIVHKVMSLAGNGRIAERIRSIIVLTICGTYTLTTGAGPSITRAFIFIAIAETARLTRRYKSTKSLFYSALIIQLTISPMSIKSIGFQLSYAAMAGIAFVYPHIRDLWPTSTGKIMGLTKRIWESASLSIACQITTGPLAWLYFHTFPKYFLLTNLIAIPLTGLIIPFAIINMILNQLGACPHIMTRATECLVDTLTAALEIISSI